MPVRPPSLRAIAAFEAAARHQSFTRAADELNLTQSAISHAIRSLEERIGMALFERCGRNVVLTEAGRGFVRRLRLSLELISDAFEMPRRGGRERVVVGASPGVLERLIAPRLARLLEAFPEHRFELRTLHDQGAVTAGEVDVAVLFGSGACPGLARRRLAGEGLIPVCAPGPDLPRRPDDLIRAALVHQPEHPWRLWLDEVGLADLPLPTGVTVDSAATALELARCGIGVILARSLIVEADLATGRLVRLFEGEVALHDDYSAIWNPAVQAGSATEAFVEWLATDMDRRATRPRLAAA